MAAAAKKPAPAPANKKPAPAPAKKPTPDAKAPTKADLAKTASRVKAANIVLAIVSVLLFLWTFKRLFSCTANSLMKTLLKSVGIHLVVLIAVWVGMLIVAKKDIMAFFKSDHAYVYKNTSHYHTVIGAATAVEIVLQLIITWLFSLGCGR